MNLLNLFFCVSTNSYIFFVSKVFAELFSKSDRIPPYPPYPPYPSFPRSLFSYAKAAENVVYDVLGDGSAVDFAER